MRRARDITGKIQQDLVLRSQQGIWGQPLALMLVFLTTHLGSRHTRLMGAALALLLLQTALRVRLLSVLRSSIAGSGPPVRFDRYAPAAHLFVVLFCAFFWGCLAATVIGMDGYHDQDTLLLVLYHSGIAFAVVNLLVHDLSIMRAALALLYLPPIVSQLIFGTIDGSPDWRPVLAFVFCVAYLLSQGGRLHVIYRSQVEANEALATTARRDYLTGLANRLQIDELLEKSVFEARCTRATLALLYLDLDGFKQINDRFSHRIGDLFLCEMARRFEACAAEICGDANHATARLGGDEFAILLPRCPDDRVTRELAKRVVALAERPALIEGHSLACSVSVGVSLFPRDADTPEGLLRAADQAMYGAKNSGKNRVCFRDACFEADNAASENLALLVS